jgi:hypothetical protein
MHMSDVYVFQGILLSGHKKHCSYCCFALSMLFFISPASYTALANGFHTTITDSDLFCLLNIFSFSLTMKNCKHMTVARFSDHVHRPSQMNITNAK